MSRNLRREHLAEYCAWQGMKTRCYRKQGKSYPRYGGRGIHVCDEWRDDFAAFLAHVGPKPSPGHSIGRIDNDGHYEPGNVRWENRYEQSRNKHNNRRADVRGTVATISDIAEAAGLKRMTVFRRAWAGKTGDALIAPPNQDERLITFDGVTQNLTAWCKQRGIPRAIVSSRLNRGWSIEKALTEPHERGRNFLTFRGKTMHLCEWARETGIPYIAITMRLKRGWPVERALSEPVHYRGQTVNRIASRSA